MNAPVKPRTIRIHPTDNVAVVVNDGGLPAGTALPGGPTLVQAVPQGHKVALTDLPAGTAVRRYNVVIGHTAVDIPAGGWVNERAAASGDHLGRAIDQAGDHPAFAVAEMRFAEARENVGYRHAGGAFDLVVGVGETHSQPPRKAVGE